MEQVSRKNCDTSKEETELVNSSDVPLPPTPTKENQNAAIIAS